MKAIKRLLISLITLGLVLNACRTQPPATIPPTTTVPATLTSTLNPSLTATTIPTLAPSPRPTNTPQPPQPTATATPTLFLTIRQPTRYQLLAYLQQTFPEYDYTDPSRNPEEAPKITYADVSGDGEDDLILLYPPEVDILIWSGQEYARPFNLFDGYGRSGPISAMALQDLTQDSIPEVLFDNIEEWGGTGEWDYNNVRRVIHCQAMVCAVVWEGTVWLATDDYNASSMERARGKMTASTGLEGRPSFQYLYTKFGIYHRLSDLSSSFFENPQLFEDLQTGANFNLGYVFTSTLSLYSWTGNSFEFNLQKVVALPYQVKHTPKLSAIRKDGISAAVSLEKNTTIPAGTDTCHLFIDGQAVGQSFGCMQDFIDVEWKDITGYGKADAIVTVLSGAINPDWDYWTDKTCLHQRLIAFSLEDKQADEIADVAGCVVQVTKNQFYGVRLEDVDGDGQPEIRAATEKYLPETRDEIYRWNGQRFVFWSTVPSSP